MRKFSKADVSEQQLEDLVRRHAGQIEEGLVYLDHQKPAAGGRLDVLLVDSGKALVVAELKITQDDGMMLQGVDYYDYITTHIESLARQYKTHGIDPTQQVRLFLIAPSFSQTLVNRCKWLDLPISLFTYTCLKLEGEEDLLPVFNEQQLSTLPEPVEITHTEDHLNYITDADIRAKAQAILTEIEGWKPPGTITLDSIKYAISIKVNNRVFAYFKTRRKHFLFGTYDAEDDWNQFPVKGDDDWTALKPILKAAMERKMKG